MMRKKRLFSGVGIFLLMGSMIIQLSFAETEFASKESSIPYAAIETVGIEEENGEEVSTEEETSEEASTEEETSEEASTEEESSEEVSTEEETNEEVSTEEESSEEVNTEEETSEEASTEEESSEEVSTEEETSEEASTEEETSEEVSTEESSEEVSTEEESSEEVSTEEETSEEASTEEETNEEASTEETSEEASTEEGSEEVSTEENKTLRFVAVDEENGREIKESGITFEVLDAFGKPIECIGTDGIKKLFFTTNELGVLTGFAQMKSGIYTVREIRAPGGYVNSWQTRVQIDRNGVFYCPVTAGVEGAWKEAVCETKENEMYTIPIKNNPIKVSFGIEDAETKELIAGAQMELIDEAGTVVHNWISSEIPYLLSCIPAGSYWVRQKQAVDGYKRIKPIRIYIDAVSGIQEKRIENICTKIKLAIADQLTGELLPGAVLQIINEAGTVVYEWTSTREAYLVKKLPIGIYRLKEVKAPEGYLLTDDVIFQVEEQKSQPGVLMKSIPVQGKVVTDDINPTFPNLEIIEEYPVLGIEDVSQSIGSICIMVGIILALGIYRFAFCKREGEV